MLRAALVMPPALRPPGVAAPSAHGAPLRRASGAAATFEVVGRRTRGWLPTSGCGSHPSAQTLTTAFVPADAGEGRALRPPAATGFAERRGGAHEQAGRPTRGRRRRPAGQADP